MLSEIRNAVFDLSLQSVVLRSLIQPQVTYTRHNAYQDVHGSPDCVVSLLHHGQPNLAHQIALQKSSHHSQWRVSASAKTGGNTSCDAIQRRAGCWKLNQEPWLTLRSTNLQKGRSERHLLLGKASIGRVPASYLRLYVNYSSFRVSLQTHCVSVAAITDIARAVESKDERVSIIQPFRYQQQAWLLKRLFFA